VGVEGGNDCLAGLQEGEGGGDKAELAKEGRAYKNAEKRDQPLEHFVVENWTLGNHRGEAPKGTLKDERGRFEAVQQEAGTVKNGVR